MGERPELKIRLKGDTFRNFYYLKEELVEEKKIDNTEIKEILDKYLLDNII